MIPSSPTLIWSFMTAWEKGAGSRVNEEERSKRRGGEERHQLVSEPFLRGIGREYVPSPHAGAPTSPLPTVMSFLSMDPTCETESVMCQPQSRDDSYEPGRCGASPSRWQHSGRVEVPIGGRPPTANDSESRFCHRQSSLLVPRPPTRPLPAPHTLMILTLRGRS